MSWVMSLADDLNNMAVTPFYNEPSRFYSWPSWSNLRTWPNLRQLRRTAETGLASPIGKDGFQVSIDVGQFKPSELIVKVVDNDVVIEGKHEEREDEHGYISRHFVRRYHLPKDYDPTKVASTLSSDGVLTVTIPKPAAIEDKSNERIVQIQQTGPAHLNIKKSGKEEGGEKKLTEKK